MLRVRFRHEIGPFYYCLYSLDGVVPSAWESYITDPRFKAEQMKWNDAASFHLVRDKLTFHSICRAFRLPTVPILGAIRRITEDDAGDVHLLGTASSLAALFLEHQSDAYFLKLSRGAHGDGAFVVSYSGGKCTVGGKHHSPEELYAYAIDALPDGESYLVQPRLRNARAWDRVLSSGLGTVRLVTVLGVEGIECVGACLRITVGTNVTDNFSLGSAGNLVAGIDLANGRLRAGIGSISKTWPDMRSFTHHPDSGHAIEGFSLPSWKDVVDLAKRAHECFRELKSVGWDIAMTDDGPLLVEGNHGWDLDLMQVADHRGYRPTLSKFISIGL